MKSLPNILYKYFPLDGEAHFKRLESLFRGKVYFSSPSSFNDPFEINPILPRLSVRQVESFLSRSGIKLDERQKKEVSKSLSFYGGDNRVFVDSWVDKFGVLCLTPESKNLLMWSHYASSHTGVCVGFDTSYSPFDRSKPVIYNGKRPRVLEDEIVENKSDEIVDKVFYTKSAHWEYEEEWRCLKREVSEEEKRYYIEAEKNGDMDIDEVVELLSLEGGSGIYPFSPKAIRRVYIGSKASSNAVDKIAEIVDLLENKKIKAIKYELDHAFYGLKVGEEIS